MTIFEVDKPFPVSVPLQECAIMELWSDGLIVLIQMPGCTETEIKAFHKSFDQYSYLETLTPISIAVWVFDFPKPFGEIDVNFNARIVNPEYIAWYLDSTGGAKNLLTFYLVDGEILKGIKAFGLRPEAVTLFHNTIRKQLALDYSKADYDRYLESIFLYTTRELFELGVKFSK